MAKSIAAQPLWVQITAMGFGAVLFTSLAISGLSLHRQYQEGEAELEQGLTSDIEAIQSDMAAQQRTVSALALAIAGEPDLADQVSTNAREDIVRRFARNFPAIKSAANVFFMSFQDASGNSVARIHDPASFGDNIAARRRTFTEAMRAGTLMAGIEPGRDLMGIFATAPIYKGDRIVGMADIGTSLTNDYFVRLSKTLKADIAVHIRQEGAFRTQNSTFAGQPALTPAELDAILGGGTVRRLISSSGRAYVAGGIPIKDFSGKTIGVLEVASDVTPVSNARTDALWTMGLSILAISVLALSAFGVFARSLASAIGRLTSAMSRLAGGELDTQVPSQARRDEIGAMARAVEVFKAAGIDKLRLAGEAAQTRADAETLRAQTERAREAAAREQAEVVGTIGDRLEGLAKGDLTVAITETFPTEYRKLREDFNSALAKLKETIKVIAGNGETIRGGSTEISEATGDLSKRTEQQAASLEETAAALDEITATVKSTAAAAISARDVVSTAKRDAEHSGEVVNRAVAAMADIDRSSGEISQIIGVIDEIAFQTNLLALNAGVEAARAGEAGRGFAVVASEVRALAQRSAEAAKEIKALIATSTAQVASGVKLVDEAGKALGRIAAQVGDINGIVTKIAASAQEQAVALQQVNTAVNQMDQMTQQNAAMVEQTTAASQSLAGEATQLAQLIGQFRIDNDARPSRLANAW